MQSAAAAILADDALVQVDRTLAAGKRCLSFPAALERQYENETGIARNRALVRAMLVVIVVFLGLFAVDYVSLSDIFGFAVALRLTVATVVFVPIVWVLSRNPSIIVREALIATQALAIALSILILMTTSRDPLRADYHYGIVYVIMVTIMVMRPRFRTAVLTALALVAVHAVAVLSVDAIGVQVKAADLMLTLAMSVFALLAVYNLEKQERQNWLRSLGDRLRAEIFRELSIIDPMTGLGNRRGLDRALEEIANSGKPGQKLAVAIADIDHFKAYNDNFGHVSGDDCLRRVAGTLVAEARKHGDQVFRYGGEEFVVLLRDVGDGDALQVAERMRRAVEAAGIPHVMPKRGGRVTLSIGVAMAEGAAFDADALIAQADSELYRAKRAGRNQVWPFPFRVVAEQKLVS